MKNYQALLISTDGKDYVLDFHNQNTVNDVWDKIADMGSKWFFYPLCFVITDDNTAIRSKVDILRKRIIDTPEHFEEYKNVTVKTAMTMLQNDQEFIQAILS